MKFINVGAGSLVAASRVVSASSPDSAPLKRLIQEAKEDGSAIDLCQGKKCRSVLILDNGMVILSSLEMDVITKRLTEGETNED